jgi:hypothetical protein
MEQAGEFQLDPQTIPTLEEQLADWKKRWAAAYDQNQFSDETAEARLKVTQLTTDMELGKKPSKELVKAEVTQEIGIGMAVVTIAFSYVEHYLPDSILDLTVNR